MNALEDLLAPHADEIATFAGTVTCLQFLSGGFLLKDILQTRSSDGLQPEPLIGGVTLTVLSLKLGLLMGDVAMINVNLIGLALNIIFTLVFYLYASDQSKGIIFTKVRVATLFTLICLCYSYYEDIEKIEFRFGMLITGILVIIVGSPLLNLGDIIRKKSTEGLPFPFILSGTIVAGSWMIYGISIRNIMVAYQNLFLLLLNVVQLMLFAIYPRNPGTESTVSHTPSMMMDNTKPEIINSKVDATSNTKKDD